MTLGQMQAQVKRDTELVRQQIIDDNSRAIASDPWGPNGTTIDRLKDYMANDFVWPTHPVSDVVNITIGSAQMVEGVTTGNPIMAGLGANKYVAGVMDQETTALGQISEQVAVGVGAPKAAGDLALMAVDQKYGSKEILPNALGHSTAEYLDIGAKAMDVGDVFKRYSTHPDQ